MNKLSERQVPEELKTLFDFIDDRIEITLYGNDGFDNQEVLNGRERMKKWILDAWSERRALSVLGDAATLDERCKAFMAGRNSAIAEMKNPRAAIDAWAAWAKNEAVSA
jgi:hypothetical protein